MKVGILCIQTIATCGISDVTKKKSDDDYHIADRKIVQGSGFEIQS